METVRRIVKVCNKVSLYSQKSDFDFWQGEPYEARLAALEQIRREYNQWKYGAESGLQRVYSIVKR